MKVVKFGGTSVGSVDSIEQICQILKKENTSTPCVVVVSAFSGITDKLTKCAELAAAQRDKEYHMLLKEIETKHMNTIRGLFPIAHQSSLISKTKKYFNALEVLCDGIYHLMELSKRSLDKIMCFGELISSYILNEKLKESGLKSIWKDSRELIVTDQ